MQFKEKTTVQCLRLRQSEFNLLLNKQQRCDKFFQFPFDFQRSFSHITIQSECVSKINK